MTSPKFDTPALIDHHKRDCNRYVNGQCQTVRCMRRGGYTDHAGSVDYDIATCEAHETVMALSSLPPASSGAGGDLLQAATDALARQAAKTETDEAWAERMAPVLVAEGMAIDRAMIALATTPEPRGCPTPGADVVLAREAVVKAAMHWWSISGNEVQAAWAMGDCGEACERLFDAEVLAADAQKGEPK